MPGPSPPPRRSGWRRRAIEAASQSTFFAIGMAVFFLFFAVEFGVRGLLEEREGGTLSRLLVTPISPASVIGGKAVSSFVVGLVSTSLLVVATTWLLQAEWGDPVGVVLLVLGGVLAAVGVTAMVATLARTTAQAGAWVSIVAVVGGLLGGTFFPISQAGFLGTVRFLSPQGWLMEGFQGARLRRVRGDDRGPARRRLRDRDRHRSGRLDTGPADAGGLRRGSGRRGWVARSSRSSG
ncbi:MAG: ABC transporter permease [Actinomycetota bacterium]